MNADRHPPRYRKARAIVDMWMVYFADRKQRPTVQHLVPLTGLSKQTVSRHRVRWITQHPESEAFEEVG